MKNKDILVRPMKEEDIPEVMEIEKSLPGQHWTQQGFADSLHDPQAVFFTALDGGRIAGYAGGTFAADEGEILNVAVDAGLRGQGMGLALVKELIGALTDHGAENIFLEVREGNTAAQQLYEKCGFIRVGARRRFYRDPIEDAWIMKRGN